MDRNDGRGQRWIVKLLDDVPAGSGAVFGLRIGATVITVGSQVILGRILGPGPYGIYTFAMAGTSLMAVGAGLGFRQLAVREVSRMSTRGEWSRILRLLLVAAAVVLVVSVVTGLAVLIVDNELVRIGESKALSAGLKVALPLIGLSALLQVVSSGIRGLGRAVWSELPDKLLMPGLFLVSVLSLAWLTDELSADVVLTARIIVTAVVLVVATAWLVTTIPGGKPGLPRKSELTYWIKSALPFLLITGMNEISAQADLLMLGAMAGSTDTGVYGAALKGGRTLTFTLYAVNIVMAPVIASQHEEGSLHELSDVLKRATRIAFGLTLIPAVVFLAEGDRVLGLVFGSGFAVGYAPLVLVTIGNVISVGCGPAVVALKMSDQERIVARLIGISVVVNVILNAVLIPHYGMTGAAVAFLVSTVGVNIASVAISRERLGLNTTIFEF